MDIMQRVGKWFLKLTWFVTKLAVNLVFSAAGESSSSKRYGHGQAYGLLYDDKITIAEFVDAIED